MEIEIIENAVRDAFPETAPQKVKSIVCFEIAPEYRGKGIALLLLQHVCEDAVKEGYDVAEVYPIVLDTYEMLDFTGSVHLYEKAGLVQVAQQGEGGNADHAEKTARLTVKDRDVV